MTPIFDDLKEMWTDLPSWLRVVIVVAAAAGMMVIAGTQRGNAITAIMWIAAFLVMFLLPTDFTKEDER